MDNDSEALCLHVYKAPENALPTWAVQGHGYATSDEITVANLSPQYI